MWFIRLLLLRSTAQESTYLKDQGNSKVAKVGRPSPGREGGKYAAACMCLPRLMGDKLMRSIRISASGPWQHLAPGVGLPAHPGHPRVFVAQLPPSLSIERPCTPAR